MTGAIAASMRKKNPIKIGEFFCSHFSTEDGRRCKTFLAHYFKKGKNTTEMQKKICAVYGEGAVMD